MRLKNFLITLLLATAGIFISSEGKAQCLGMNPKNCVRLSNPPGRSQVQYHKPQKQVQKRVWVQGRYQYSRRGARWIPGRWVNV